MTDQEMVDAGLGTAPNDFQNAYVAEGEVMVALQAPFMSVNGIFINTSSRMQDARLIDVETVEIEPGTRLYLHVQVAGDGRNVEFGVANWLRIFKNAGYQSAIIMCLEVANPDWMNDPALVKKVLGLPGALPPYEPPPAEVPAEPNWQDPRDGGMYGSRLGDTSPDGTEADIAGVIWLKGKWVSPFESIWKLMPQPKIPELPAE